MASIVRVTDRLAGISSKQKTVEPSYIATKGNPRSPFNLGSRAGLSYKSLLFVHNVNFSAVCARTKRVLDLNQHQQGRSVLFFKNER